MESMPSAGVPLPSLVVSPKTLVEHWCKEWRSFFPSAKQKMVKSDLWPEQPNADFILVVSYEELRTNRRIAAPDTRWNYVILDEGHCIKNPASRLFEAVCSLTASHRLILSGTPVQNSPADLWALFNFLIPGYLSAKGDFRSLFLRKIMACRSPKATEEQIQAGEAALEKLHRQCLPFIMRRIKADVLSELPDKIIQDYPCQLMEHQRILYEAIVDRCAKQRQSVSEGTAVELSPLHALIALRKLVDHPMLVVDLLRKLDLHVRLLDSDLAGIESSGKMVALRELLEECQIGSRSHQQPSTSAFSDEQQQQQDVSRKISAPRTNDESLPKILSPHRALVFCQWKATIDLISEYIDSGAFGADISYLRLDGSTPVSSRQTIVDSFNTDRCIDLLLLTTHVGGLGLNLTGADTVIFVDHDWNPFKDLQAIDRAHRIGQTKTVNVYRLVTTGTVEEKVMSLQKFKSNTANVLVGADNRSLSSMATGELLDLLSLDSAASSTGGAPPPTKQRRTTNIEEESCLTDQRWSLEDLWDYSWQYEEQNSLESFLAHITR